MLQIVAIVGGITMLGAALMAFVQDDIKRVLAYSTISQLAYMIVGMSMGPAGRTGAFFHLFTHAFFKALLFLGSGAVIHAVHSNNMSEMGGLRKRLPITFWTFLIGSLALSGVPPLAGFWSKDELLVVADHGGHDLLFAVLLVTALLTAFYMTRAVLMTFFGEYRGHGQPHEAPRSMTGVLVALAGVTVFVGLLGAPQLGAVFGQWVFFEELEEALFVPWIALVSTAAAIAGIARWVRPVPAVPRSRPAARPGPRVHAPVEQVLPRRHLLEGDRAPDPGRRVGRGLLDNQHVLDAVVNGAAALTRAFSRVVNWFDRTVIDGAVNGAANIAGFTGGLLRYIQSGNVQRYAAFLFAGVVVLAIIFTRV